MARVPEDYDADPGRWQALDRSVALGGDVHPAVAARICAEDLRPVLDVGGGDGILRGHLPAGWPMVVLDRSPRQVGMARQHRTAAGPAILADAMALPVPDCSVGAVAMLWMLYHLAVPEVALAEARRVLRPGGLLAVCAPSRRNDPELVVGYPPTTFDAEEAPAIVGRAFGAVTVETWDAPLTYLADADAVRRYCRSHRLGGSIAQRVEAPLWLTKRGCLIDARRDRDPRRDRDARRGD